MNINVTPGFVLAGEATFTVSNGDGKHFTYHVYKSEPTPQYPNPSWFIKVLTGPDNSSDYSYVGMVKVPATGDPIIRLTGRSKYAEGTTPLKVARWALRVIWQVAAGTYTLPPRMSIKHVGKCGRCGRALTNPASLDTGLGPECADAAGVPWQERRAEIPLLPLEMCARCGKRPRHPSIDLCHDCAKFDGDYSGNDALACDTTHPGHPSNYGDR